MFKLLHKVSSMRRLFLISVFIHAFQLVHAEYFKHIGMSDGLNQFSVMTIYQDTLGRMWFGTKEGISIYDGSEIVSYRDYFYNHSRQSEKVLIGNDIYAIQGDRKGDVFVIADKSLLKYDIREETFHRLTSGKTLALASYQGDIWCALKDSILQYNTETGKLDFVAETGIERINCLTVTRDTFYVGTHKGLYTIGRTDGKMELLIPGVDVYRVFESSQKEIWVGCRMQGLFRVTPEGSVTQVPYDLDSPRGINSHQIREFVEDDRQNIWFGTFDGLHKYNVHTHEYSNLKLGKHRGGLEHSSIFSLYKDRQGTIWIGSYFGGVNYFNPEYDVFSRYNYDLKAKDSLYFSYISSLAEDKEHNLWIGTDGGGLSCINLGNDTFANYEAGEGNAIPHNNVKSISYDEKRNCLYIGTHIGGLSRYDIAGKRFRNYYPCLPVDDPQKPDNIIYNLLFRHDCLYVAARNGFFMMNPDTHQFRLVYNERTCQNFDVDEDKTLWLGLGKNISALDPDTKKESLLINLEEHGARFEITKVKVTKSGLYIATLGSGVFYYDKTTRKISNFTVENNQLLDNYCYNLAETNQGNILITCNKGFVLYSPVNQDFRFISISPGFPASAIVNGCGVFVNSTNEIFIGDVKGFTSFQEQDLKKTDDLLKLYISALSVNNQRIYPGDDSGILQQSLPFTRKLQLEYDQNNLVFSFALSNYANILQDNSYEYKLEGFDKDWISTQQMHLYYTNLDPGKYVLRIRTKRSSNHSGIEEISQQIIISPPWYNTVWAWAIYLLVTSLCVYYFVRSRMIKRSLAFSLEKERFEKLQIEHMNQAKLLFFTNVSHEFRTPLTLIINHIDLLLQNMSITPALYDHVIRINKHAQRMRSLVTELLDFRKFDQNHITLKISEQNVVEFIHEIYFSFLEYARQRNIDYRFNCTLTDIGLWFDAWQLEKVIFNLLSNAFKYTPKGGSIEIRIFRNEDVCIEVADSGTGMTTEERQHIFERFYQANNEQKNKDMTPGTGIGLALAKSIVEKHYGTISVDSEAGKGSVFSVHLLRGKEHFLHDTHIRFVSAESNANFLADSIPTALEMEEVSLRIDEEQVQAASAKDPEYTLLIVEDNEDLINVLQQLFAPFYRTLTACNGKQGLELAISKKPDLIVSDVMMPEMTGTEMCIQLKNNIDTCHIPIVLLTALNTTEQNIEGLNRGADDYITKPFNARILLARCNNIVRNRLLIQQQFTHKPISEIDLTTINPLDKKLLKQTVAFIDEHIDDPDFDIPQLCRMLGMGRTLLYAKFKVLTGMTPNNFVLNYKLKKAAILLRAQPEMQIGEIADSLGFGSSIYFSRCFKTQFNMPPQQYRKEGNT